jgi:hypothetical protein
MSEKSSHITSSSKTKQHNKFQCLQKAQYYSPASINKQTVVNVNDTPLDDALHQDSLHAEMDIL